MTYNIDDSEGADALDVNQAYDRWQFAVKSGCAVSINSGTLGQTDTLSVASGGVTFDGSSASVSSQSVQIDAANVSNPRKDVVYIDSAGTAQVAKGSAEAIAPTGATRFDTYRPAPVDLSATNATVLAEVWVPAGASSITASDLRDRRVFADLAAGKVTTDQINDNDVNLTSLVDDGTYADILDAIANEPPTNSVGTRHLIEPGTYTVGTGYTITWSNRTVEAFGRGRMFNSSTSTTPVKIEWTGGSSPMLTLGDGSTGSLGGRFAGITFMPSSTGGGSVAINFNGQAGVITQDWEFENVHIRQFGGDGAGNSGVTTTSGLYNFGHVFKHCGFTQNQGTVGFGQQQDFYSCLFTAEASPGFDLDELCQVYGGEINTGGPTGLTGMRVSSHCRIHARNIEGDGSTGSVGVEVAGTPPFSAVVTSPIKNWAQGIEVSSGSVHATPTFNNITNEKIAFTGGNNSHNESFAIGSFDYADISHTNTTQSRLMLISTRHQNTGGTGLTASDVPLGWYGFDGDVDGSGNGALVYGGTSIVAAKKWSGTNL